MAVQTPYLSDDGDLNQATRKRAGQSPLVSSLPPVPGNPARAKQMQSQFDQPVTNSRGEVITPKQTSFDATNTPFAKLGGIAAGLKDFQAGASQVGAGLATAIPAYAADGLRIAGSTLAGGDPDTLPGGRDKYRAMNSGMLGAGVGKVADAGSAAIGSAQAAGRDALGVAPAKPSMPSIGSQILIPAAAAAERVREPADRAPITPAAQNGYALTGIGAGIQGGEIAARRGAGGIPEFTNQTADPQAIAGAQAMPTNGLGGVSLRTPGVSNMADDVPLAQRGSINNIGNGIGGGLSVGEDGDAQMALGRFERANQIRAEMRAETIANRPRELGDNGGKVTVVRDSSRAPSIAEMVNERRGQTAAKAGLDERRVVNDERRTDADIARNNQQTANDQLSQLKIGQEIELGRFSLDSARRLAEVQEMLADPSLDPGQRRNLESTQNALITSPADRIKNEQANSLQRQKTMTSLFKTYNELQPVGEDGRTRIPFELWVQPALQAGSGQGAGAQGDQKRATATEAEVAATIKASGKSRTEVLREMEKRGITING